MKNLHFSFSLGAAKKTVFGFLHRFHLIIFVVAVLGSVAVAILLLNATIALSSDSGGYTSTSNNASFDEATIKRIEELKTRDQNSDTLDTSKGRSNPFVE